MIKIAYHSIYCHPLPKGHRFPMVKYELIPQQLLHEGTITAENFFEPQPARLDSVLRVHTSEYVNQLLNLSLAPKAARKIGFPLTKELVEREFIITQGTIDCTIYAKQFGVAFNVAGGTHHAYSDYGEGFCVFNDVAVAAYHLLDNSLAEKILIVDLDVHQGNGTAKIFENEPRVFTFSIHGKDNYPMHKERSDLDIALTKNTDDATYLRILQETLPNLIEEQKPDFLFYVAGVDILATDSLGKLRLSIKGCKMRDEIVFRNAIKHKIPLVVVMAGGYSPKITDILEAHCNTFRLANDLFVF